MPTTCFVRYIRRLIASKIQSEDLYLQSKKSLIRHVRFGLYLFYPQHFSKHSLIGLPPFYWFANAYGFYQYVLSITSVVIPNTVTHIGLEAFYWCTGLTSITIGDSVNQIGSSAFYHCTGLQTVTIPSSVEEIGSGAFSWCNLSSLTFNADSLTSDLFCHYHNNISNITIGNNVKVLPNGLCSGHDSLSSIFIPASVKIIGYQAFTNNSLSSIVVSGNNMVYDSRNNCNAVIRKSDSVIVAGCRNTVIPDTVKTIGRYSLIWLGA